MPNLSKFVGLQSFRRGVLGDHQGLRDEGHAGAEQGDQPLHGQAGFPQVRKTHNCEIFFTAQVCHELFTFPNHQQSDG